MATGNLGSLVVGLVLNTDKFSKGAKTARKDLLGFNSAVGAASRAMRGFGVTLAAGFTIGALRNTINELDNMADAAKRLGTSVKSLGGLMHSAFMSDVSSDSLIRALTIMEKNVGNNAKALNSLGLNIGRLKQLDASEMFIQIAEAINKMPTAAERTAAAMAAFGRSGADLMELIAKGRAGITGEMKEAGLLGLAPTDAEIERIEQAKKAMDRLTQALKGLKQEAAISLAPALAAGAETGTNILKSPVMGHGTRQLLKANKAFIDADLYMQEMFNRGSEMFLGVAPSEYSRRRVKGLRAESASLGKRISGGGATPGAGRGALGIFGDVMSATGRGMMSDFGGRLGAAGQSLSHSPPGMLFRSNPALAFKLMFGGSPAKAGLPPSMLPMSMPLMDASIRMLAQNAPGFLAAKRMGMGGPSPGFSALERGTASAFSQERRSRDAAKQNEIAQKQLKQDEQQTKLLQSIDKTIRNVRGTEPANFD